MLAEDGDIQLFLSSRKVAETRMRWWSKNHNAYVAARARLRATGADLPYGRLIVQAHKFRVPYKLNFVIVFRDNCIFRLDVSPGASHRKTTTLQAVNCTHWQIWPNMDKAEPDDRELGWTGWLDAFLRRGKIELQHPIAMPSFETSKQLGLEI